MVRACSACAMWRPTTRHGRGTTTGYCTHPAQARATFGDYSCKFYVRAYRQGFDANVAFDAFERYRVKEGGQVGAYRAQDRVDLGELRRRSARARKVA